MKQYECKDCPNRTRACHETCEKYLAIKQARAELKEKKEEQYEYVGYCRSRTHYCKAIREREWLTALGR